MSRQILQGRVHNFCPDLTRLPRVLCHSGVCLCAGKATAKRTPTKNKRARDDSGGYVFARRTAHGA